MNTTCPTASSYRPKAMQDDEHPAMFGLAAWSVAALVHGYAFHPGITARADANVTLRLELPPEACGDPFRCADCRASAERKAGLLVWVAGILAELATAPPEYRTSTLLSCRQALRAAMAAKEAATPDDPALEHWRMTVVLREAAELLTRCWPAVDAVANALTAAEELDAFQVLQLTVTALIAAGRELPDGLKHRLHHERRLAREAAQATAPTGACPWDSDPDWTRRQDRLWSAENLDLAVAEAEEARLRQAATLQRAVGDLVRVLLSRL